MHSETSRAKSLRVKLILLGKILKPHALKGAMTCFLENTQDSSVKAGKKLIINDKEFEVEFINFSNAKKTIIKFIGLDSINELNSILGQKIFINRVEIDCDDGEIVLNDLINLDVYTEGTCHGKVDSFYSNGPQEILVVKGENNLEIPLIKQFIKSIDLEKKSIEVILPEYL